MDNETKHSDGCLMYGYDLGKMTLIELIEAYGQECAAGNDSQGWISSWPDRLMEEIKVRVKGAEEDGGGTL